MHLAYTYHQRDEGTKSVLLTKQCHKQRRLPASSGPDDEVYAAAFEHKFVIYVQLEVALVRSWLGGSRTLKIPGESGFTDTNHLWIGCASHNSGFLCINECIKQLGLYGELAIA